jgi:heme/copper-type cytochrome/quinol oxidase subunit 2
VNRLVDETEGGPMKGQNEARKSGQGTTLMTVGVVAVLVLTFYAGTAFRTPETHAATAVDLQAASTAASHYTPQTRNFVMTIVPSWVHEVTGTYDYLNAEFGKKGLLAGKEVWGFSPSGITVYQGDTVVIELYNPSSDPHTWTIAELGVNAPVGGAAKATVHFVASKVGVFQFNCEVGEHFPFMTGQLTVLPASAGPQS